MKTGYAEERDARLLAKALEAKKITDLEICRAIHCSGSHRGMPFLQLARMLRKSRTPTVRDLTIVRTAVGTAGADGFIKATDEVMNLATGRSTDVYCLTEAGRFLLRTSATGPRAHSILDDIDAEMAGEA